MKYIVVANCKNCNHPIYGPKSIDAQKYFNVPKAEFFDKPVLMYTCDCNNIPKEHVSPNKGPLMPDKPSSPLTKEEIDRIIKEMTKSYKKVIEDLNKFIDGSKPEFDLMKLIEGTPFPLTEEGLKGATGKLIPN
jgi:hypothetical protein